MNLPVLIDTFDIYNRQVLLALPILNSMLIAFKRPISLAATPIDFMDLGVFQVVLLCSTVMTTFPFL